MRLLPVERAVTGPACAEREARVRSRPHFHWTRLVAGSRSGAGAGGASAVEGAGFELADGAGGWCTADSRSPGSRRGAAVGGGAGRTRGVRCATYRLRGRPGCGFRASAFPSSASSSATRRSAAGSSGRCAMRLNPRSTTLRSSSICLRISRRLLELDPARLGRGSQPGQRSVGSQSRISTRRGMFSGSIPVRPCSHERTEVTLTSTWSAISAWRSLSASRRWRTRLPNSGWGGLTAGMASTLHP